MPTRILNVSGRSYKVSSSYYYIILPQYYSISFHKGHMVKRALQENDKGQLKLYKSEWALVVSTVNGPSASVVHNV